MTRKTFEEKLERAFMKENIEQVIALWRSEHKGIYQWLQNDVRNANGCVGNGFVCVPMPDKERTDILNALFGKKGW
jgi:hypothetical protein